MITQDILFAMNRVVGLPYFWQSMSWATIIAMFFGALIYDGDIPHAKKGVCTVCAYLFMIGLVMGQYIWDRYPVLVSTTPNVAYQVFVYPSIIFFVSFFWFIGFVFAVSLLRYLRKLRRKNNI